ncbi:hypothetical protein BCAR13_1450005 [Paraburkholderia caribensis]|nr:hypothetical protein BCAR13_1450005 [Paraburkholderia caribensis]
MSEGVATSRRLHLSSIRTAACGAPLCRIAQCVIDMTNAMTRPAVVRAVIPAVIHWQARTAIVGDVTREPSPTTSHHNRRSPCRL